jgi:hypothetical protein
MMVSYLLDKQVSLYNVPTAYMARRSIPEAAQRQPRPEESVQKTICHEFGGCVLLRKL